MTQAPTARFAPATAPALLRDLADVYGDLIQIADTEGELSFTQVERRSANLARGLLASGVGKGEKVGILMGNGCDWVVAWFAVTRIGAVAVLLSTFAKPRELGYMLRHADVCALLAWGRYLKADLVDRLEAALPGLAGQRDPARLRLAVAPFLRRVWVSRTAARPSWSAGDHIVLVAAPGAEFDAQMLACVEAEVTAADPALIIFTSGATSDPKAVLHSQGSVFRHAHAMAEYMTYRPGDRCLTTQPLFWVGGLCTSLLAANIHGAALLCPATPSPSDMLQALRGKRATHIALWPAQLEALREVDGFRPEDFAMLRHNSAQQLGLFGLAPAALTPNALGMSETFGPHSMEFPQDALPENRAGSYGRVVAGMERKIIDPESGAELPAGQEGELCVRGYAMMLGFYKRERADTFESDGFLRTGDCGWLSEDGHLFFTGRRTEMIKTAGANVAPSEVEALLRAVHDVMDVAVVGVPDPRAGEIVVAAIVLKADGRLDEPALRAHLRGLLSDYKVPKRIVSLEPDEVPRTESHKIRKPALVQLLMERLTTDAATMRS